MRFIYCLLKTGKKKVEELKIAIEKCSEIVKKLHFKGCELRIKRKNVEDVKTMDQIMIKVSSTFEFLEMEAANLILDTFDRKCIVCIC